MFFDRSFLYATQIFIYCRIGLCKRNFLNLPAGTFAESQGAATLRGFAEKTSAEVDKAQELFYGMEAIVGVFDREGNFDTPANSSRQAIVKMEQRLIKARERLHIALENHAAFVNGSIAPSRPL